MKIPSRLQVHFLFNDGLDLDHHGTIVIIDKIPSSCREFMFPIQRFLASGHSISHMDSLLEAPTISLLRQACYAKPESLSNDWRPKAESRCPFHKTRCSLGRKLERFPGHWLLEGRSDANGELKIAGVYVKGNWIWRVTRTISHL